MLENRSKKSCILKKDDGKVLSEYGNYFNFEFKFKRKYDKQEIDRKFEKQKNRRLKLKVKEKGEEGKTKRCFGC